MRQAKETTSKIENSRKDPNLDALIQVFEGPLRSVVFPDVSYDRLVGERAHLDELRAQLEATRAQLEEQTQELLNREAALNELAVTALEYAKVYSRNDVTTLKQLLKISFQLADGVTEKAAVAPRVKSEKPRAKSNRSKDDTASAMDDAESHTDARSHADAAGPSDFEAQTSDEQSVVESVPSVNAEATAYSAAE